MIKNSSFNSSNFTSHRNRPNEDILQKSNSLSQTMIQSTNLFYSSHFNLPISKSYIITSLLPQILLIPPTTTSNQTPPNSPQHDPRTTRNNRADTATTTLISKRHVRVREHTHTTLTPSVIPSAAEEHKIARLEANNIPHPAEKIHGRRIMIIQPPPLRAYPGG